ncbi:LppX_LprAFG lipoprotein [Glycomyces halotolerans]
MLPLRQQAPRLLLAAASSVIALSACSDSGEAPEADETMPDAAAAMADVENVRFDLAVDGNVEGLEISSADGVVTSGGDAEGTGVITAMGMDVEVSYVIVGEQAWVKGFTGDYQEVPVGGDQLPYNPTIILSGDGGVARLLETYDEAEPQDTETVDGVDTYRYLVTFDPETFADFIPAAGEWNEATVWFDQDTLRVVKAEFAQGDATVTLHLSDYNDTVAIEAP